ncbi:MAG: DUF3370 domain-containing protein [Oculatellaceae cyanobacterium Prado106]|jgi:hypothetical protein|nr:DUF3370 domain-containing protein [Oculatellaceae cyanobacterium Prado106]
MLTVLSLISLAQLASAQPSPAQLVSAQQPSTQQVSEQLESNDLVNDWLQPVQRPDQQSVQWTAQLSAQELAQSAPIPTALPIQANAAQPNAAAPQRNTPPAVTIPQRPTEQIQAEVLRPQVVRPLPGQLDDVPVFNSNSPEIVQSNGILLSTFPTEGMQVPSAHLNFPFEGRFDIFAHHIARGVNPDDNRTLFVGVVVYNPSDKPVTVTILQGVTYLSQEAPFTELPAYVANPAGAVFAGPGSRTTSDILQDRSQPQWPEQVTIPPKQAKLLMNMPIPLRRLTVPTDGTLPPGYSIPTPSAARRAVQVSSLTPVAAGAARPAAPAQDWQDERSLPTNGRTVLMRLSSDGPVYLASLGMYAPQANDGSERVPSLSEWLNLLVSSGLSGPRDRRPTPPNARTYLRFFYGRVAGVARGSEWTATATDSDEVDYVSIPQPGQALSYVISTVDHNTFGTGQIQSAPMLARYPDTAYRAHGNYGVQYNVTLPLYNNTDSMQTVNVMLQTPLQDEKLADALRFREPPDNRVFFRGTVRLSYRSDLGLQQVRYVHVVQQRGQEGQPLVQLRLPKGARREVEVQFVYPPDATPPQVLTVQTAGDPNLIQASQSAEP